MKQEFNVLNHYKHPKLKLCRPDRAGVAYLKLVKDLKIKLNFNSVSECSFSTCRAVDEKFNRNYDLVKCGKLIYADQFGYFIITKCDVSNDGIVEQKDITAVSAEFELTYSRLTYLKDTYKLYNPLNANDETTILGKFIKANPLWQIGHVDNAFWDTYRTYDESSTNWYSFLVKTVEESCQCIVKFDNANRIVSLYSPSAATKKTNIYISHKNLIKNINIEEKSEEVFTALNCYGSGELDISRVNPMGTNTIYNFEYFKTLEWLTQETIDALDLWNSKYQSQIPGYKKILTTLREKQILLVAKRVELKELEEKLKAVEVVIAAQISHGINNTAEYSALVGQKNQILSQISNKKNEISSTESDASSIKKTAENVNRSLAFENNFTPAQLKSINAITYIDDCQNESFIKTDIMNEVEIQDQSQLLFDHCLKIMNKVAYPRYYFSADLVNFIFIKDFKKFTKQTELGCVFKVGVKKDWKADVVLLSMTLDFDNPTSFPLEFSNRYRLDNGAFEFEDIYSDNSRASSKMQWDSAIWGDPLNNKGFSEVRNFIDGNFDAAKNSLMSAKGIGVSFDGSGLHLRKYIDGVLQPYESWIIDDMFAMSDDNFNSPPKVAIGRVKLPNSQNYAYGINAEFVAGYLICGDNFVFENRDKDSNITQFRFDGNGAYLYNSKITIENDFSQIKLNPNDPSAFTISGKDTREAKWTPKIYMDTKGNANFVGKITAEEGLIAGWQIKGNGLFSPFGDYIRNDGYAKFSLLTLTPFSGTFDGNVYAKNLKAGKGNGTGGSDAGYVNDNHIDTNSINGAKMKDNSIAGTKLMASYKDSVTNAIASVEVKADKNSSSITSLTEFTKTELNKVTTSITNVKQIADKNSASITSLTSYTNNELGKLSNSITSVSQVANANSSTIRLHAQYISTNANNIASIELYADHLGSRIDLNADNIYTNAREINAANATIRALAADFNRLDARVANIDRLYVTSAEVNSIVVNKGYINSATCNSIIANKGYITEARCRTIAADYAKVDWGNIDMMQVRHAYCQALWIDGKAVRPGSVRIGGSDKAVWVY